MSTPTRRSERKRAANTRLAELQSSPTQPRAQPASKKRKASNAAYTKLKTNTANPCQATAAPTAAPQRRRKQKTPEVHDADDEETSSDETTTGEEEPNDQEAVNDVIRGLLVPDYTTAVAEKYNNSDTEQVWGEGNINAYARLCGKDWTYYLMTNHISFGRAPGPQDPQIVGANADSKNNEEAESVEIDLGPNKVVSRTHAELQYNVEDEQWYVSVRGRNGIKINDTVIKKGESKLIKSGTVIAIANTEMLFQSADGQTEVDQIYLDRIAAPTNNMLSAEQVANSQRPILPAQSPARPPHLVPYSYHPYPPPEANGQGMMAPAAYPMQQPATPTRPSPPKPNATGSTKKKSPGTASRGKAIMMESTEQIDYSLDENLEIKPQCSYASMITWAITSTQDQCLSLNNIYEWIKAHYAYYRFTTAAWQNSIRHNLSLSPTFEKIPRRPDEPGKGMKWRLKPEHREAAIAQANKQAGKGGGRVSSAPGTPGRLTAGFVPPPMNGNVKSSPTTRTPPLSSYPQSYQESYTPTRARAPQILAYTPVYAPTQAPLPVLSDQTSPMPIRGKNGHLTAIDSSPTLTSGAWSTDAPMRTPAPRPYNLNPPQPNTNKLPTSHMPESSPAPFWKSIQAFGSTPARMFPESSPLKNGTTGASSVPQSSSPPAPTNGADSPTRKSATKPPLFNLPGSQTNGTNGSKEDDEDDVPIDISKYAKDYLEGVKNAGCPTLTSSRGFTTIGQFHQQRNQVAAGGVAS